MWTLAMKYKVWPEPTEVADRLLQRLKRYEPFIFHTNLNRTSVYIHFRALPNGLDHKLRVSTHDERQRYGYKWQLRLDGIEQVSEHKRWSRYHADEDSLVKAFERYYNNVERSGEEQKRTDFDRWRREFHGLQQLDQRTEEREGVDQPAVEGAQ